MTRRWARRTKKRTPLDPKGETEPEKTGPKQNLVGT
jgi:hypothetical protein